MRVNILTVGDELLIGQVIDTNSAWMAQQLNLQGLHVGEKLTVSDQLEPIKSGIRRAFESADIVLMTGGLGPTKDDVTKKALAEFYKVGFVFSQETFDRIVRMFERWGRSHTEAHRAQCLMPQNARLLPNKMGTAPGMWFEEDGKVLVSMPGVPFEMQYLMEYEVLPELKKRFPRQPIVHRTVLTVGEGESRIAERLQAIEDGLPENISLSYLPSLGAVRLRLTGTGPDEAALTEAVEQQLAQIRQSIPELIFGYETEELEAKIGELLQEKGWTLATAESCTGGYLAHRITSIAGSSAYFMGSVIAYSNAVKMQVLQVKEATLEAHGAVSEQTVVEMVAGALDCLKTDLAVAVSGIAGPG
ncbi:MAG: CinA family nicotinamide mononucleotide deamidase-related protein, partial [Phaeodactylibacter sp.]|nr:CinA family nicotinamide mononucleotide deamidase-related protein [Phaeodactylibacter sp.]